jgi:hypothetical protein
MSRKLTSEEVSFLEIYSRSAVSYGQVTEEFCQWAFEIATSGLVEARDESTLESRLSAFNASGKESVSFFVILDYSREIESEHYNYLFTQDVHPETQAETALRYLVHGWKWYCKKYDLPSSELVTRVRASILQEGDARFVSPVHLLVTIDTLVANPSTVLSFLVWFNQEWCADVGVASRFDIVLNNRRDSDYHVSLTPSIFGDFKIFDGNF